MSAERLSLDANILFEDLQHDRELEGIRFQNPFVVDDPFASSRGI